MPEQVLVYLLKYAEFFTTYSKGKNEQTFFVCINRLDRQELHRLILFQFKSNTCFHILMYHSCWIGIKH